MGIFQRIGDIVAANLNELIERCEDPEKLLRQAVREMEDAVEASLDGAAKAIASERMLEKELTSQRSEIAGCEDRAGRALRANDLPAAHRELRRKLEHEKFAEGLERDLKAARASCQALRRQVGDLRAKLVEARRKLPLLAARKRVAEARRDCRGAACAGAGGSSLRFERLARRIDEAEEEAEARASLEPAAADPADRESEEADIERRVGEELAALRAKLDRK